MKNRSGLVVYQSAAFSMESFPLELARQAFAMATVSQSTQPGTGLSDPQQLRSTTVSSIVLGDFSCVR